MVGVVRVLPGERVVQHLDPVPDGHGGARLQMLDAADVGGDDALRLRGEQVGDLAVTQLIGEVRLQHRIRTGRTTA